MERIAGDIGGTKSWLAWVAIPSHGAQQLRFEKIYVSADFASAEALLRQFMADAQTACQADELILALPGPLHAQRVRLTNLDWTLDATEMQTALGIARVRFINDFQAAAAGVATLTDADVIALNAQAAAPGGVRAITGAGTGLGLAFMLADAQGRYQSFATEGGHIDFAPANALQARLLEHLRADQGHVSWERVASGSALKDLYRFCCAELGHSPAGEVVDGAALTVRAESGDAAAETALDLFIDLYGAWVGNVALMYQPFGGLYIAGGVATHMLARMQSPRFMAAATDKGRMRGVVERTPIFLITCKRLGVQGAMVQSQIDSPAAFKYQ
ncbi:glucokinase [Thiobacillus sp.]|uniref:glucokinase n=1 Tax=Thiobacillus sp. TaxID=924 RepID=UPI00286D6BFB|nr:glucokinase [Thiobacillus sp.]